MPRVLMNGGRGRSGQPEPEKKLSVLQFLCLRKNNRCFFLYEYFHVWNVCMNISMLSMDFCDLVRDLLVIHWVVTIQTGKCWDGILHVLQWKIHYLLPNGSLQKLCLLFCNPFCLHISYGMWVCALPCLSLQQRGVSRRRTSHVMWRDLSLNPSAQKSFKNKGTVHHHQRVVTKISLYA